MKTLQQWIVLGSLFVLPTLASAQADAAQACTSTEKAVRVVMKESFRFNTTPRDGTHRYFMITGCRSETRVRGEVRTGREADAYYLSQTPVPLDGTDQSRAFAGRYQDLRAVTHGTWVEIKSDDGTISTSGNFYNNRDVSYTIAGTTVPASLLR
jgi:hypothetical protein